MGFWVLGLRFGISGLGVGVLRFWSFKEGIVPGHATASAEKPGSMNSVCQSRTSRSECVERGISTGLHIENA
eukprot:3442508-Rhodomonas_salina.7